ncbi:MAG: MBL fold metallo-hydrolase [Candidatus Cloacimonetes bacterium]|jgi:glyoxylase-like metal-dependent hydrolase (beta-lactamase superfamily II)|nr:MBL fold metallo-hydrolase [Candidatus Cloacimonadota bacterium]
MISAGYWFGDAGASMGIMPKALWQKLVKVDDKNRIKLAMNLLLIRSENKNILVDTGLGNKISEKVQKIYSPSKFILLESLAELGLTRNDIDIVVLTHLHFDHAGGIVSFIDDKKQLTFPNALHVIQQKEWEIAQNPDELNNASYNFKEDLKLLEDIGNYKLIDGDFELTKDVVLELTGGHSEGTQVVRIDSDNKLAYYPGDILPMEINRHLAVTTAFDINRKDTFNAKKKILSEIKERDGIIFLGHDSGKMFIEFGEY